MANLTKNVTLKTMPRAGRGSYVAADTIVFYAGGLVGINAAGYMAKWADTAGHKFLGILLAPVTGAISALPPAEGRVNEEGVVLQDATVASLTQADVNGLVYSLTDNTADLTLSAGANVKAVGWVKRFKSAGVGDVQLFTPAEHQGLN